MMAPHDVGLVQSLTTRLLGEDGTGAGDGPAADTATDWS